MTTAHHDCDCDCDCDFENKGAKCRVDISEYEFPADIELSLNQTAMCTTRPEFVKRQLGHPVVETTTRSVQTGDQPMPVSQWTFQGRKITRWTQTDGLPFRVPMPVPVPFFLLYNPDREPPPMPPQPPKPKRQYHRRKPLPPRQPKPAKIAKITPPDST